MVGETFFDVPSFIRALLMRRVFGFIYNIFLIFF
jgi:hypothetical protein